MRAGRSRADTAAIREWASANGLVVSARGRISSIVLEAYDLVAQHRVLVTEHHDLDVLGGIGAGEQRRPARHTGEHQIDESEGDSGRSCCAGSGR